MDFFTSPFLVPVSSEKRVAQYVSHISRYYSYNNTRIEIHLFGAKAEFNVVVFSFQHRYAFPPNVTIEETLEGLPFTREFLKYGQRIYISIFKVKDKVSSMFFKGLTITVNNVEIKGFNESGIFVYSFAPIYDESDAAYKYIFEMRFNEAKALPGEIELSINYDVFLLLQPFGYVKVQSGKMVLMHRLIWRNL